MSRFFWLLITIVSVSSVNNYDVVSFCRRGSVPAPAQNYRNVDAPKAATMGSSRHHSNSTDKEYMNLDVAPSTSKKGNEEYVVMRPDSVHEVSDNYVNLDPTTQNVDKPALKNGDSSDNYVNFDPTPQTFEKKSEADNFVNFDPNSHTIKSRTQSSVNQKPTLPSENSSGNYVNCDPASQAFEKKSESHVSDNYVNFDLATHNSSVRDPDSQYANLVCTNKTGVRKYHSLPFTHKHVPTTRGDKERPPHSHIVFHHFSSDKSLNNTPTDEISTSVSELKNDDSTDSAAHPVIGPSYSEEATRPQQQFDPSQTSNYENLTPFNQTSTTDPEYELMTPGQHAGQDEQAVTNQVEQPKQQPVAEGYEDFVPVKANGNSHSNHDNCDGAYSLLHFQTERSIPAKPVQDDSSSYSLLSHSQKFAESTSSSSNYSRLELSGSHESPKTGFKNQFPNQNKSPMLPPQKPKKPLVPPRELKKRIQQPEPSSLFSGYPELPPRNPSFQEPTQPPAPPAGPKPTSYPQSINPPSSNQSSLSLNYCEVVVLPAEIGQPKFRARSAAIDQTIPTQKSTKNYAMIDAAASLGLQKALQQQEHDRLA